MINQKKNWQHANHGPHGAHARLLVEEASEIDPGYSKTLELIQTGNSAESE